MLLRNRFLLLCLLAIPGIPAPAQAQNTNLENAITADSLKTGNYKDVLTSFFQLAFNNLSGPNKSLNFNSNPFAIMARANEQLYEGQNWYDYRHLRDLNFNVGLGVDSSYRLKNFSAGIKYAIINKRDLTVSKAFYQAAAGSDVMARLNELYGFLGEVVSNASTDPEKQLRYKKEAVKLNPQSEKKAAFGELSAEFRTAVQDFYDALPDDRKQQLRYVKTLLDNPNVKPGDDALKGYEELRSEWLRKPLLTISANGVSHTDQFAFANASFGSELLFGIPQLSNNRNNTFTCELNAKALLTISDDSLRPARNLDRQVFSSELGFNFALRTRRENKSYLEFKLSGSYNRIFSAVRLGEEADNLTFNTEIRLRVYDDIWVPVVLRYDPENQNLFGFFNISANFTGLRSLLGRQRN